MKIVHEEILVDRGDVRAQPEWLLVYQEIQAAIATVSWPPGNNGFNIRPVAHGNGVKPIKDGCMTALHDRFGWQLEAPVFIRETDKPGNVDALRKTSAGDFVFEWETGNISSSHRALNKIALGLPRGLLFGGVLVLPTRKLYPYLTDRIGNYEELLYCPPQR